MYKEARFGLEGTPLARHSMNQRVMKRVKDGERTLARRLGAAGTERERRARQDTALLDLASLHRLLRNGIYKSRLEAAVHVVASLLAQVDPAQWR